MTDMNCKDCVFKNSHPEDVSFCFALSLFIQDIKKPVCSGDLFKKRLGEDRLKELTEALEELRDA